MTNDWQKDYPSVEDLSEKDLDDNSSLKKMLRLVGEEKRVIDFGCATGYFSQLLNKRGCSVTGVEINADAAKVAQQYCERVIVADLDFVSVTEILTAQSFDVAVFGDVLEHLRNPWKLLEETRQLLKPEGYIVASIPNIAHGAIRLALLQGRFEYMDLGLLDNTHLRFFTRKSVESLFERAGYFVEVIERTKLPVFSASKWVPHIDKHTFDAQIIQQIEQEEEADTFQFVVRAFPISEVGKYAALTQQHSQLVLELEQSQSKLHQTQMAWEQSQSKNHYLQTELERCLQQVSLTQFQLEEKQAQLEQLQSQLGQAQTDAQQLQESIVAMQSSKFWKLRISWFKFKKLFLRNS